MFTQSDIEQITGRGSSVAEVASQVERFKKGFPWLDIVAPATPERGIEVLDEGALEEAAAYVSETPVDGKCKFVPASGAASRMFKDIFAGMDALASGNDLSPEAAAARLAASIEKFAFYTEEMFGIPQDSAEYRLDVARKVLTDEGLGYGSKPKGVIKFHKYENGARTAFAEHLVEGQEYMRNEDGSVNLTVTISPEHKQLFEDALAEVKDSYEAEYGVKFNVRFTFQDKATDTVAVDTDNKPFRKEDGSLLFRPAGHGALIHNLNNVEEELVSIKNIDNVSAERMLPLTSKYKKALMGRCLQLRDIIFGYLRDLDAVSGKDFGMANFITYIPAYTHNPEYDYYSSEECQELCDEIEDFLYNELCIGLPKYDDTKSRVEAIREKLNRPIRVCGMVRNQGEPGGGPFIIRAKDGSTSLQILESVQIDGSNPEAAAALKSATHFNPVDIVCCLHDYKGGKFNLPDFVDEEAGFISSKSYQGRELKALELPGLWNGSMSDWNTLFVEVPVETFNPVKVVLDLLRPAHQ
ncbi:MAG: DUF4301 family protein [Bacteroidia bacterium]|nr:DUF4301 family protein [Bacteroidia bacterium]